MIIAELTAAGAPVPVTEAWNYGDRHGWPS